MFSMVYGEGVRLMIYFRVLAFACLCLLVAQSARAAGLLSPGFGLLGSGGVVPGNGLYCKTCCTGWDWK